MESAFYHALSHLSVSDLFVINIEMVPFFKDKTDIVYLFIENLCQESRVQHWVGVLTLCHYVSMCIHKCILYTVLCCFMNVYNIYIYMNVNVIVTDQ